MQTIDPIQLQRLIDGELDTQQIQSLLSSTDTSPEQWRQIALGFVENQIWSQAIQSHPVFGPVLRPVGDRPVGAEPASSEGSSSRFTEQRDSNLNSANPCVPPTKASPSIASSTLASPTLASPTKLNSQRSNYSWFVIAASLLVAATIGFMVSQIQNRNVPSATIADHQSIPPASQLSSENAIANLAASTAPKATPTPKITPASLKPDYHLEVPADNHQLGIEASVSSVPLYRIVNAEQLQQLNLQRSTPALPTEMVRQLAGSGYQMEEDLNFISGRLGDGRSFMVPVRTIRFVPTQ